MAKRMLRLVGTIKNSRFGTLGEVTLALDAELLAEQRARFEYQIQTAMQMVNPAIEQVVWAEDPMAATVVGPLNVESAPAHRKKAHHANEH